MRRLLFLVPVLFGAAPAAADGQPAPERFASVAAQAAPADCWVGQPLKLTVTITLDPDFLEKYAVPLFARACDVPVKLEAPWLEGIPDAAPLPGPPAGPGRLPTMAINDRVAAVDGQGTVPASPRPLPALRIERRFLPGVPGEIRLAAPVLRYAFATRFADDFLDDRRPLDRQDGRAEGEEVVVRVRPLPEEGRPAGFGGAVGSFTVRAGAEPLAGAEGGTGPTLRVRLRIEGDGNLAHFDTPRLDALEGFHVYGLLDDRGSPVRTVTYDVAPLSPGTAVLPPIPFSFFDPGPPAIYRTVRTEPVRFGAEPETAGGSAAAGEPGAGGEGRGPSVALLVVAAALLAAAAAGTVLARRRARRRPGPEERRLLAVAAAFRERLSPPDADLPAAFTAFLADRLGCTEAQVVAPDLRSRLAAAGVPPDLAEEAAALLDRLVASRYGGHPPTPADHASALSLSTRLTHLGSDPKSPN